MSNDVVIHEPYEISVWLDKLVPEADKVLEHYEEQKSAIIGANDMDTPFAAHNPNLILNVNGSVTLTFEMFYRCFDEWYGEEGDFRDNPYTSLLSNEAKIKFKFRNKWYDLLIKKIEENSENYTFKYTTSSFFINELSKNGFKVELDVELENNQGTVTDLALKIMKETDWIVDVENSDILVQTITEPIYAGFLSKDIKVEKVANYMPDPKQKDTVKDISTIHRGERVYFFYSDLQAEAPQPLILYRPLAFTKNKKEAEQSTYYHSGTKNGESGYYYEDYMVDLNQDVITNAFNYCIIGIIDDEIVEDDTIESSEKDEEINESIEVAAMTEDFVMTYHGDEGKTKIPDVVQDTLKNELDSEVLKDELKNTYKKLAEEGKNYGDIRDGLRECFSTFSSNKELYESLDAEVYSAISHGHGASAQEVFDKIDTWVNNFMQQDETQNVIYQQIGDVWFRTSVTDKLLFAPSNNFRGKKVIRSPRSTYDVNLEWPVTIYTRSDKYINSLVNLEERDKEFEPNSLGHYVKYEGTYIIDDGTNTALKNLQHYSKKEYYGYIHTEDYSPNLAQNYLANSYDYANVDTGWVFDGTPSTQDDLANGKVSSEEDGAFTGQIYYLNSMNFQLDPSVEKGATSVLEMRLKSLQNERFYKDSTGKYFKSISHIWVSDTDILSAKLQENDGEIVNFSIVTKKLKPEEANFKTVVRYIEMDSAAVESLRQNYLISLRAARNDPSSDLYNSYNDKTDEELEQIVDRIISDQRYSKSPRVAINTGIAANRDVIKTLNKGENYIFAISLGRYEEGEKPPEYKEDSIRYGSSPPDARYRFVPEDEGETSAYDFAVKELLKDYKENPLKYMPAPWQPGGELYQKEYNQAYENVRQQYIDVFYSEGLKGSLDARFRRIGGKNKKGKWQKGAWNNGSIVYRTIYRKAITELFCGDQREAFWRKVLDNASITFLADDTTFFEGKVSKNGKIEINGEEKDLFDKVKVIDIFKIIESPLIPTLLLSDSEGQFQNQIILTPGELDNEELKFFQSELSGKTFDFKWGKIFDNEETSPRKDCFGMYVINDDEKLYVPPDFLSYNGDDINSNKTNYRYPNYEDEQISRILNEIGALIKSDYMEATFSSMLASENFVRKMKKAIRKAIRELWWDVESLSREKAAKLEKSLMFPVWGLLNNGGYTYQKWENWWKIYAAEKAITAAKAANLTKIQNQSSCIKDTKESINISALINTIDINDIANSVDSIKDIINNDSYGLMKKIQTIKENYIIQQPSEEQSSEDQQSLEDTNKLVKFKDLYISVNSLKEKDIPFEAYLNGLESLLNKAIGYIDKINEYNKEKEKAGKDVITIAYLDQKIRENIDCYERIKKAYNTEALEFDGFYILNPMYLKMLCDNDGLEQNISAVAQILSKKYGLTISSQQREFFNNENYYIKVSELSETLTPDSTAQQINSFYSGIWDYLIKLEGFNTFYSNVIQVLDINGGILDSQFASDYLFLFTRWLQSQEGNELDLKSLEQKRNIFDGILLCLPGIYTKTTEGINFKSISLTNEWPCTDEFLFKALEWKNNSSNETLATYTYKHIGGTFDVVSDLLNKNSEATKIEAAKMELVTALEKNNSNSYFDGIMIPVTENYSVRQKDYYVLTNKYVPLSADKDKRKTVLINNTFQEIDWTDFMQEHGGYYVYYNNEYITLQDYWNIRAEEINFNIRKEEDIDNRSKIRQDGLTSLCSDIMRIEFYDTKQYFRYFDNNLDGMSETWLALPNLDHSKGGSYFLENGDPTAAIVTKAINKDSFYSDLDYTAGYFRSYNEELDREYTGLVLFDNNLGGVYTYDQSYELVPCFDGIGYYYPSLEESWVKDADENNEGKLNGLFFHDFMLRKNDYGFSYIPHDFDDNGEQLYRVIKNANGAYVRTADVRNSFSEWWEEVKDTLSNALTSAHLKIKRFFLGLGVTTLKTWFDTLNGINGGNETWTGLFINDNYLKGLGQRYEKREEDYKNVKEALNALSTWQKEGFPVDFILADAKGSLKDFYLPKQIQAPYGRWLLGKGENTDTYSSIDSYSGYYFNTRGNNKIKETKADGQDVRLGNFECYADWAEQDLDLTYDGYENIIFDNNKLGLSNQHIRQFSAGEIKKYWKDIQNRDSASNYNKYREAYLTAYQNIVNQKLQIKKGIGNEKGTIYYKYNGIGTFLSSKNDWKIFVGNGIRFERASEIGEQKNITEKELKQYLNSPEFLNVLVEKVIQYYIKYTLANAAEKVNYNLLNPEIDNLTGNFSSKTISIKIANSASIKPTEVYFWTNPRNKESEKEVKISVIPFTKYHWYQFRNWGKDRYDILPPLAARRVGQTGNTYNLLNKDRDLKQQTYMYIPADEINVNALTEKVFDNVSIEDFDSELNKVSTDFELFTSEYKIFEGIIKFFKNSYTNIARKFKKLTRSVIGTELDSSNLHDYTEKTFINYTATQNYIRAAFDASELYLVKDNKDDYFTSIKDDDWTVDRYEPKFVTLGQQKFNNETCYFYDPQGNYFRPYNRKTDANYTLFDLKIGSNTPVFQFTKTNTGRWMYFSANDWYIPINRDRFVTPKRYKKVRDFDNGGYVLDNGNFVNFDGYMSARTKTFKLDYDNLEISFCDSYNFNANNFAIDLTGANVPLGVEAATYDTNKKKYLYFDCSEEPKFFTTEVDRGSIINEKKIYEKWAFWKAEVQENFSLTENLVNPIGMVFSSKTDKNYAFIGTQLFKYYPYYADLTYQKTEINKSQSNESSFAETFVERRMVIPGEVPETGELSYQSYYIYEPEEMNDVDNIIYEYVGSEPFDNGWQYDYDELCQKVRSIKGKESNYFNLLQSLCETFECWVNFAPDEIHNKDGSFKYQEVPVYVERIVDEEGKEIPINININGDFTEETKTLLDSLYGTLNKYPYKCLKEIPLEVKKSFISVSDDEENIIESESDELTVSKYYNKWVSNYKGAWVKVGDNNYKKVEEVSDPAPMNRYSHLQKTDKQIEFEKRQKAIAYFDKEENVAKLFNTYYMKVPLKKIQFKEYVGQENYAGFKYGVNLKSTKRNIDSAQFTSRIVVKPNTNKYADNKFCTIQRAQDNFLKENFFYNFDYYVQHGLLKYKDLLNDLYSDSEEHLGYFTKLNGLNKNLEYAATRLADLSVSIDKIKADYETAALGRQSATEEIQKLINLIQGNYDTYGQLIDSPWTFNKSKQYVERAEKGVTTLAHDYDATFYINGIATTSTLHIPTTMLTVDYPKYNETLRTWFDEMDVYQNKYVAFSNAELKYKKLLETRQAEYDTIVDIQKKLKEKKEELNKLFYYKYSRYIQEGSWTNNEYLDDNLYFLDALSVLRNSAFPKVSYQIDVVDLYPLEDYHVFDFKIGDRTYVEDVEFFGYVDETKSPVKEEIIVSEISFFPEDPIKNNIKVQNYRTQFEDLFKRITTASQQLKFSESNYGASSTTIGFGNRMPGGNLVENVGLGEVSGVKISDGKIILSEDGTSLKLTGSSINFIKGDKSIRIASIGGGVAADELVGQLNLDRLVIGSEQNPGFKLDRLGLTAYATQDNGDTNFGKFVRHDKYGIYGIDLGVLSNTGNDAFTGGLDEIEEQANFALTWNGFTLRSGDKNNRVKIGTETDIRMQVTEGGNWKDRIVLGRLIDRNNEEYYGFRILNNSDEIIMETESDGELYLKQKLRIANFSPTYAAIDTDTLIQQVGEDGVITYIDPNLDSRNLESRVNLGIVELFKRTFSEDGTTIYTKEDTIPNYYDSATYLTKVFSIAANMETLDENKAYEQFRRDQIREYETYIPYSPGVDDSTQLYIYNERLGYQPYISTNSLDTEKWKENSEAQEANENIEELRETNELQLYKKVEQTGLLAENETFALFDNGNLVAKNAYIEGNIHATTGKIGLMSITKDGDLISLNYEEDKYGFKIEHDGKIILGQDNTSHKISLDGQNEIIYGGLSSEMANWKITSDLAVFKNADISGVLRTAIFERQTIQASGGLLYLKTAYKILDQIVFQDNDDAVRVKYILDLDYSSEEEYFNEKDFLQFINENGNQETNYQKLKEFGAIEYNGEEKIYIVPYGDVEDTKPTMVIRLDCDSDGKINKLFINGSNMTMYDAFPQALTFSTIKPEKDENQEVYNFSTTTNLILGQLPSTLPFSSNIYKPTNNSYGLYCDNVYLKGSVVLDNDDYYSGMSTNYVFKENLDLLFWGTKKKNKKIPEKISDFNFYVTTEGILHAKDGYFSGLIESSEIRTPIITGSGDTPALTIKVENVNGRGFVFQHPLALQEDELSIYADTIVTWFDGGNVSGISYSRLAEAELKDGNFKLFETLNCRALLDDYYTGNKDIEDLLNEESLEVDVSKLVKVLNNYVKTTKEIIRFDSDASRFQVPLFLNSISFRSTPESPLVITKENTGDKILEYSNGLKYENMYYQSFIVNRGDKEIKGCALYV